MAKCGYCGTTILFGGSRDGNLRYCNDRCMTQGRLAVYSQAIPEDYVQKYVWEVHQGSCPKCRGNGPVDVHTSYKVWSALLLTSWSSEPQVSCRACGVKSQVGNLFFSLLAGWWGFPWGLIMTPIQVCRNLFAIFRTRDPIHPSPELANILRISLAAQVREMPPGAAV